MTESIWPRAAASGVGSLPGTDPVEAHRTVFGELPLLPHLVELPDRGPGAEMIGRTASLLVDLPVQIEPSGWRFAARAGVDQRRARDLLRRDLDAFEDIGHAVSGAVKIQMAGPLTLAASIELVNGQKAIADHGAVREIAESLAAGLSDHLADVSRRVPDAAVVVQIDEPSVPAVLAAQIATPSGYGTLRAVTAEVVSERLRTVLEVAAPGRRVVHCCADDVPIALFRSAGADAVSVDIARLDTAALDQLGEAVDDGASAWLGVVSTVGALPTAAHVTERVLRLWDRLAFDPGMLAERVVVTPACGLAGTTPNYARAVMTLVRQSAERLAEQ